MSELHVGARPRDLVPGVPEDVEALAARLATYADQAGEAAALLRAIDSGSWVGEAAEAFRDALGELPAKLERGCEAFWEAVAALRSYASALRDAQATAARAIELFAEANHQSGVWAEQHRAFEEALLLAEVAGGLPPGPPPPPSDPGEDLRHQADRLVEEARGEGEVAARRAAARLEEAGAWAPDKPGLLRRALGGVGDFVGGVAEGTSGLVTFGFKLSPTYALVDPEGYVENLTGMGRGLAYGVTHPVEFAKAVTNWDMWMDNPARALGQLVPELALGLATAGAGAAAAKGAGAVRRVAGSVDEVATLGRVARSADDVAPRLSSKALPRPLVTDPKLDGLLGDLYRPGAQVGSGSTADALRSEIARGIPTRGRWHLQKARDYAVALQRWLANNPNASAADRTAAQAVIDDLTDAINEVRFP